MTNAREAALFRHNLEDAELHTHGSRAHLHDRLGELGREVREILAPAIAEVEASWADLPALDDEPPPDRHACVAAWELASPRMPELSRLLGEVLTAPHKEVSGTDAEIAASWYVRLTRHLHGKTTPEPWASTMPDGYTLLQQIADACEGLPPDQHEPPPGHLAASAENSPGDDA